MRTAHKHAIELYLSVASQSKNTIAIIEKLQKKDGTPFSVIARRFECSRQYVAKVHDKFMKGNENVTQPAW